ncbi:SIS domain-containing protein [Thalassospira marina]|uniref:Glucosamine-fructose-6-phosphate aminotransferase n=1 Tax=Thalassospira marina TaxID=2048283 RepID=A0A2N3KWZ3_9PROT|nr:SIS domain-containing protein [Thalassospira marina]PKR55006.1 glucosamine-fructose-6-phosphate aminotransferase [Thalassospira marina]
MNVTERVIVEQFAYWEGAITADLPALTEGTVVVVGCGTSYYLAQAIASAFNIGGRNALAVPGGEWARRASAYLAKRDDVCVVALSRSGESTETVQAVDYSRKNGIRTIALTCEKGSSIDVAASETVYLPTHGEEGVVMTSSASLMLIAGLRLAGADIESSITELAQKPLAQLGAVDADFVNGRGHFVYLGAGAHYGIAAEGALKLQEMSLSYAQTFHPMEYRHGPISLIDENSLVVLLYSADTTAEEAKLAKEIQDKGGKVIGLGGPGDISIPLSETGLARVIEMLPALQVFGERIAQFKNLDTTAPRHLTKVVVLS